MNNNAAIAFFAAVAALVVLMRLFAAPDAAPAKPAEHWRDPRLVAALGRAGRTGTRGIVVVAPASGVKDDNVRKAHEVARELGIRFPEEALDAKAVPYNANADEVRLDLLLEALNDPAAETLWALRGGYGCGRLLPGLSGAALPETPKLFIGYSDLTYLHLFFQRRGWPTIHGDMFWELTAADRDPDNLRILASLLAGETEELRYTGLKPFNQAARDTDSAIEAPLTGGNLTCLAAAAGTPWTVDAAGRVLFIEDVKEAGYKIDRMLTQLRQSGALGGARAVLLGTFTRGDDATEYALERFAGDIPLPVFRADRFGHGEKNHPLVFNKPARIEKNRDEGDTFVLVIDTKNLFERR